MERCRPSIGKMQSYIPFRSGGCRERKRKGKGKGKRKGVWVGRANEDNLEGKQNAEKAKAVNVPEFMLESWVRGGRWWVEALGVRSPGLAL